MSFRSTIPQLQEAVDSLIPEPVRYGNQHERGQARIFISTVLVMLFLVALAISYFLFYPGMSTENAFWAAGFSIPVSAACLVGLICIQLGCRKSVYTNIVVAIIFLTILAAITLRGGPLGSIATATMFVPPICAFVFSGLRTGIIWTVICYASLLVMSLLQLNGTDYPYIGSHEHIPEGNFAIWHFAYFCVFAVIGFYDHSNAKYRKMLEKLASLDELTGLPNRTAFNSYLKQCESRYNHGAENFSAIFLDLDEFKAINDQYGHRIGDAVLEVLGARLSSSLRKSEMCSRIGGDEFVILVEGSEDKIAPLLDRLETVIQEPIHVEGCKLSVTASIGIARFPEDGRTIPELIHTADMQMYKNKFQRAHPN